MELLRIVAMSMIIIGHFMVHAIFRDIPDSRVHHFLTPFFICGVNLFFLLSGYFKIRLSLSSIFRLIVLIISFRLVSNFLYIEWGDFTERLVITYNIPYQQKSVLVH